MTALEQKLNTLVVDLYKIGAVKFGEFLMKSGSISPVYLDLRVLVSHPKVLEFLSLLLWENVEHHATADHLCGVPYNALPIATIISVRHNFPMLIRRKEAKKYGTKNLIEGQFKKGDTCIIIEDVVTSGSSILETVKDLESAGLKVTSAVVIVDRGQGGMKNLTDSGVTVHSLLTLTKIMHILCDEGYIDKTIVSAVDKYLKDSQVPVPPSLNVHSKVDRLKLSFGERANQAGSAVGKALLELMESKKTNLCVAVDVSSSEKLLNIASQIGPYVCLIKTHADAISDFSEETAKSLEEISKKENFMIMEDRKFADIGNTVSLQYKTGPLRIAKWAHFVTCHSISGKGPISGLMSAADDQPRGCFLVAEMSCQDNLITPSYTQGTVKMAEDHPEFVSGLVSQSNLTPASPGLIQLTPGVRICSAAATSDGLGQQWVTPEEAVVKRGADVVVVGRGVIESENVKEAAKLYQSKLWEAYKSRLG